VKFKGLKKTDMDPFVEFSFGWDTHRKCRILQWKTR